MLDSLGSDWSRPYKIVRVMQSLGLEVPLRLRRERFMRLVETLKAKGIETALHDKAALDGESPGIEAKIRLRKMAGVAEPHTVLGHEVVTSVVSGGMSECFKVRDSQGNLRFLKRVKIAGSDDAALQRELAIYQKLERASAEFVLRVHEVVSDENYLGMVMELADGGTLEEFAEGGLPSAEASPIAREILRGLSELHALEIVHRDLKPQNILRSEGRWKLGDFGISKNLARLITQGRTFQGCYTPGYAPPEQIEGREAHPSADVYAFGKVLTFLLTGQTDVDKVEDRDWARLIRECTQREPEARPSAATLAQRIDNL